MFLANTNYYSDNININNKYYYDLLAYNYGIYFKNKKQFNFDNINKNIIPIETGFGGLGLINKENILNIKWNLYKNNKSDIKHIICEHWNFCTEINQIYIVKSAKALWFLDKYINDNKYNNNFYNYINKIF